MPRSASLTAALSASLTAALLAGCGGGGEGGSTTTPPSDAQRAQAAQTTADSQPACVSSQPFYWEIGNTQGAQASGTAGGSTYSATTRLPIASASKWVYASYVVQQRGGVANLSGTDIAELNFTSGYSVFNPATCNPTDTVASCDATVQYDGQTLGQFDYSGGHMQRHADLTMGLGALNGTQFADELRTQLGSELSFTFTSPQPAGGGYTNAADYAALLRKIMSGQLLMHDALSAHAVCANPSTCHAPDNLASYTPIPLTETWHYSIGHWIEDDPVVGDGAFSSPGAFGFYPWISHDLSTYGILARYDASGSSVSDPAQKPYMLSVACGRLIRKAWFSGQAITN
jgi:hypothetical protein